MALTLMYITNQKNTALIAEKNGVDWIFVDLEINGKEERQGHLDTVISHHTIENVKEIKSVLTKSKLLVRVNPLYVGTANEVDKVIVDGADIVMLPFFKCKDEVEKFVGCVAGRSKVCLLLETPEAVESLKLILSVKGIDYVHIGLNDLHLGYKKKFMFELLADGTVEKLCNEIKRKGITYGFGGIAQIGHGDLSAEYIIAEHYRMSSKMAILSRSFCDVKGINDIGIVDKLFDKGISKIRQYESELMNKPDSFFKVNQEIVKYKVGKILDKIESSYESVGNK